jgi:ferredoxin-NADP reductase
VASYDVTLQRREEIAEGTFAFYFEKPAGFAFKAGQSVSLALREPPSAPNSARRTFSLVSAPFEPELAVATRLREASAFKQALKMLPLGATVRLTGPLGKMTLHEDSTRTAVFIAGGIGITPFISMLRQAIHDRLRQPLLLLYSNRSPDRAAFLTELQDLARQHDNFRLHAKMTTGRDRVSDETIRNFVGDAAAPIYYLVGPPAFVGAITEALMRLGVNSNALQSEMFYGY